MGGGAAGLMKNKDQCNQALVESYNLTAYVVPRPLNMWICPTLEMSCCSIYDQFMMYYQWNNEVKKRLESHFEGIKDKLKDVQRITMALMKSDIKTEIDKSISRPFEKNLAKI